MNMQAPDFAPLRGNTHRLAAVALFARWHVPVRARAGAKSFVVRASNATTTTGITKASTLAESSMMNTVIAFPAAHARLTDVELCAWLSQAAPGETLEYHRGFLGVDRTPLGQPMSAEDRGDLVCIAERAMRLAEQGLVHLVQRRLGADTFSYLAVARVRPAGAAISFATLFAEEAA